MPTDKRDGTRPTETDAEITREWQVLLIEVASLIAGRVAGRARQLGYLYDQVATAIFALDQKVGLAPELRGVTAQEAQQHLAAYAEACGAELVAATVEALLPWLDLDRFVREYVNERRTLDLPPFPTASPVGERGVPDPAP